MIQKECLENFKFKFSYVELDNVLGYIIVEETPDIINVIDVFVVVDRRNEGIASKIMSVVIDNYSDRNVKFMLEVRKDNLVAIKLYKNFGFKVIYVREKYYKSQDALIMERISD